MTFGKAALLPVPAEAGLQQLRSRALQMTHEQQLDADGAGQAPCVESGDLGAQMLLPGPQLLDQDPRFRPRGTKPCMPQ